MTKSVIVILVALGAIAIVAMAVVSHQRKAASSPDLDQQVNDVARHLHPTQLNP